MKRINKISQNKKHSELYILYFDEGHEVYVTLQDLLDNKLVKGIEITDELFDSLCDNSNYLELRSSAIRKSMIKECTEKDIEGFLYRKKLPEHFISKILVELKERDLINEDRYTQKFIHRKGISSQPKGKKAIFSELLQKGISSSIAQKYASDINSENLVEYAKKYLRKQKDMPQHELRNRLIRHLSSKGFDYDSILATVDSLFHYQ